MVARGREACAMKPHRYEPADIEIPPWPSPRRDEPNSAPVQRCVADLRDYVRHWPVALGFGGGYSQQPLLGSRRCLRLRRRARRRRIVGSGVVITASAIVHARREAEQLRRMIAEIGPGDDIAQALAISVLPGVVTAAETLGQMAKLFADLAAEIRLAIVEKGTVQ